MFDKVTEDDIKAAAMLLAHGELVAFPTETVYGLGADANNAAALAKLFALKGRPLQRALTVHLAHVDQLSEWIRAVSAQAQQLAQHFWPGPLTLILPRAKHVLDDVTGGKNTVGVRIPNHPVALALLSAFGQGVAAPSANRFGGISPTSAADVQQELGEGVAMILDGGACSLGIESTIVDVSGDHPRIVRLGAISINQINAVIDVPLLMPTISEVSGYAVHTHVQLIATNVLADTIQAILAEHKTVVVLAHSQAVINHKNLHWISMPENASAYAQVFYARLRAADLYGSAIILLEDVPLSAEWQTIRDRLFKAAKLSKGII